MDLLEHVKNFVAEKIADMPKPEATVTDVDLTGFGLSGLTLLAKVSVANPYAVSIPICEIGYTVKSVENQIASGTIPDPGSLKADDKTMLDVTVKVPHSAVLSLMKDIGGDWDIDYCLDLKLIIDLPVIGNISIPLSYKGVFVLPTLKEMIFGKKDEPADEEDGEKEKEKECDA